ncbi:MAG: glycosyltransferase [Prevotellaceae bacterium]|nr:glycosyltransferase [Prevotellaceae bacterium]
MSENKKRVLFIYGPLGGGGAERVLIDILRNFDYARFEVDLAVICRGGALMGEVPNQVNVIELWRGYSWDYKAAFRLSKWFHCNLLLSRKMNGRKLRRDYDVEISFLEGMPLKLGALRTTAARKITWVHADLDTHRYEEGQFFRGEELAAYNKMDVVVNVSKDCERAFVRRFPGCESQLRVIYNPIDRDKIVRMASEDKSEKNENQEKLTVTTVGRLTPPKKPERLLQVAKMAAEADLPVRFTWIGDGELRQSVEKMRDDMGLSEVVELKGFCPNPFPLIRRADIMMVTSDFEGFCLVICEAMCLGVPVISTRTAGPSEILGDNEYGILTELTPESLFEALRHWVENPEERKVYTQKALSRPDIFSVASTMNQIYDLI